MGGVLSRLTKSKGPPSNNEKERAAGKGIYNGVRECRRLSNYNRVWGYLIL